MEKSIIAIASILVMTIGIGSAYAQTTDLPPLVIKSPGDETHTISDSDKPYFLHNIKTTDFLATDDDGQTPAISCDSTEVEVNGLTQVENTKHYIKYYDSDYSYDNSGIRSSEISNLGDFSSYRYSTYSGMAFALPAGIHTIDCTVEDSTGNHVDLSHTVTIISDTLAPSWIKTVAGWYTSGLIDQATWLKVTKYFQLAGIMSFDIDNDPNIPDNDRVSSSFKSQTRQWSSGSLSNTEYKEILESLADKGVFDSINLGFLR